jgi:hypothetical protein
MLAWSAMIESRHRAPWRGQDQPSTNQPRTDRSNGTFSLAGRSRQVRVSAANHDCGMDFILLTPGAVEVVIAVCVALLLGLATYLALT